MMTTVTATYAKNNFGELINNVIASNNKVLVNRAGRPAVYITPIPEKFEFNFTTKEFDKLEKGMKEFRNSFKFSF